MTDKVIDGNQTPMGYEQLTSVTSSTAQLTSPPAGSKVALIQPVTANVRWRDDGVAPTSTVGMRLEADTAIWYVGNVGALQFISEGSNAEVNISYYA